MSAQWFSQRVMGAFLNALGILVGGLWGLVRRKPLSPRTQNFFRAALGAFSIFFGLQLVWLNVNGTFLSGLEQVLTAIVAMMVGHPLGRLLRLQKMSNRLGHYASGLIASAQSGTPPSFGSGFKSCAVLFCAAPLGLLGAVTDGLPSAGSEFGFVWLLGVKAVMDGLAMTSFVKMFRWPSALSAFPVFVFLGAITLVCRYYAAPFLDAHGLTYSVNATAGFVACAIALVIFEVRKVELANYLPALAVAPILTWLIRSVSLHGVG